MRGTAYSIPAAAPIEASTFHIEDIHRLTLAMEAVEEGMGRDDYQSLTPKRRAKIVAAAYDRLLDMDQKDTHLISEIVLHPPLHTRQ